MPQLLIISAFATMTECGAMMMEFHAAFLLLLAAAEK